MTFLVIALLNAALVIGAGEGYDTIRTRMNLHNKQLGDISEEVKKKTTINVTVAPKINFNPKIDVSPTIKSDNKSVNKNTNTLDNLQKEHNIVDGE